MLEASHLLRMRIWCVLHLLQHPSQPHSFFIHLMFSSFKVIHNLSFLSSVSCLPLFASVQAKHEMLHFNDLFERQ